MLKFNKKSHRYLLDDKPVTGVTTILGVIGKPQLISWSARLAVEYLWDHCVKNAEGDELRPHVLLSKIGDALEAAKKAHITSRDKAGDIGTEVHETIETWIKTNSWTPSGNEMKDTMVQNFITWAIENKVKFLESEMQVFSRKSWFAGTLDFLCEIDGKKMIGDIKTSSGIYPEMFFQTAAYQYALEEMSPEGHRFEGNVIVNIKKDGGMDVEYSYSYPENLSAFMGALAIYRRQQQFAK